MTATVQALGFLVFLVSAAQVSGYIEGPRNQYVLEGSSRNFTCYTTDLDAGISWYLYYKGGNVTELRPVFYKRNESLFESTVSLIRVPDNVMGLECSDNFDGHYFGISIIPREDMPSLASANQTLISAQAGDSADFFCAAASGGEHILTWSRDGCLLQEDEGVANSTFVIPVITEWDGGIYTCAMLKEEYLHASHVVVDKQDYQLSVTMSLVVDVPEDGTILNVPQGTDAYMYCGIAGYPLEVEWTRNDEHTMSVLSDIYVWKPLRREACQTEIVLGPTYSVENQGKTLIVRNFTLSDEGAYVCRGRQEGRELQHEFVLKLAGYHLTACKGVIFMSVLAFSVQYFM